MDQIRTITMTHRELKRLQIMYKVLEKQITQVEAAKLLEISDRQVRRISKKVSMLGDHGVIHGLRGKPSHKQLKDSLKDQVKKLYIRKYADFGPTLASEKLYEIDQIKISRESLRKILVENQLWKKKLKGRKHQLWRARKSYYGEMVQMDGSIHDWLEGRGARMVLMGYIDDATGKVNAYFYTYEGTIPAMDSFRRYILKNGLPQSLYLDRHSTYKSQAKDSLKDVEGKESLSHFEHSCKALNVKVIHANSPSAKGRVERLFRTLQDRLVKELRLANATTLKEANVCLEKYLPVFNRRFNVEAEKKANLHRKRPTQAELKEILCIKTPHPLRNDYTVIHDKKLYQVMDWTHAKRVEVREYVNGTMAIVANGCKMKFKWIAKSPYVRTKRRFSENRPKSPKDPNKNKVWGRVSPKPSSLLTVV